MEAPKINKLDCPACHVSLCALDFIPSSQSGSEILQDVCLLEKIIVNIKKGEVIQKEKIKNNTYNFFFFVHYISKKKKKKKEMGKQVSSSIVASASSSPLGSSGQQTIPQMDESAQRALQLLTTHDTITFKVTGFCMIGPQDATSFESTSEKIKQFVKQFPGQEYMVGVQSSKRLFVVRSKTNNSSSNKDATSKQYRQTRSFQSLGGAQFESAKDNMLKIWEKEKKKFLH
ncbi:hypothetical protein RFI_11532 [Reticulomyxa filosa]|uniref:Uncharacterized protein n=1 Tax=Reticulomyxa filosa TaxID=46433 RepID=X6NI63_RETFI|nr:hypothetical protein RFI_11532 [Reticulomyxa filosa]|eukprot:ETO25603.1 hypothetical protein RFI_11532 [Reticulomyxa filosa]